MSLDGTFTSANVPDRIMAKVIKGDAIYVDVLRAGRMAGIQLDEQAAEDAGLIKNHWVWRVGIVTDEGEAGQIQFGFNIVQASINSDQAQYAGTSRAGSGNSSGSSYAHSKGNGEGAIYSDVESVGKPPAVGEDPDAGVANRSEASDTSKVSGSDARKSKPIVPNIPSSEGSLIYQPTEGAPVPGFLEVKVRSRTAPSYSAYHTSSFRLKASTTFGQLLKAMISHHMEPFYFRNINTAFLGCRDGISQAAAVWKAEGYLLDLECLETPHRHLFELLGWRYSRPTVSANLTDSDEEVQAGEVRGTSTSPSPIDRAVWPTEYEHIPHPLLCYRQPASA